MINFSLSMRAVDPSKQDGPKRAYPNAQASKVVQLDEFSTHIAKHGSAYHRSDINAVLTRSVDCLREMLLDGYKVALGDLGNFYVRLESKGAPSIAEFNASAHITGVKVYWEPGTLFTDLINEAEFVNVATRRAQDATLKAERAGQTTVDISKDTTSSSNGSGSDNTQSGSDNNQSGSDNTQSGGSGSSSDGGEDYYE
ncbi:MAG: DNA-binding protein [Prevotella sp.]